MILSPLRPGIRRRLSQPAKNFWSKSQLVAGQAPWRLAAHHDDDDDVLDIGNMLLFQSPNSLSFSWDANCVFQKFLQLVGGMASMIAVVLRHAYLLRSQM